MNLKLVLNSLKSDRQELDIPSIKILGFSILLTAVIYGVLLPFKETYAGILLYERGFTQPLVVAFGSFVLVFLVLKLMRVRQEMQALKKDYFPPTLTAFKATDQGVAALQAQLGKETNLLARRCSRVLGAYIYSRSRQVATDFAVEDSNFYQTKSATSYTLPRILIWAIPLLGFIGTVVGISAAVNGFSGFLSQSTDVGQIKEGIGTVTSGLAIAFDTTLLALLFSVLVMIPLVLVERQESRLLVGIDIYINDKILPRFLERTTEGGVDEETLKEIMAESFATHLPSPEALIEPAQTYAEGALAQFSTQFAQGIQPIQAQVESLLAQLQGLKATIDGDRQAILDRIPSAEALIKPAQIYANQASQTLALAFTQQLQPIQAQVETLLGQLQGLKATIDGDRQAILDRIPSAEALIQPAQIYANQASQTLAQAFTQELQPVQTQVAHLLTQLQTLQQVMDGDRQAILDRIPSAEALIQPAQIYADKASQTLAQSFTQELQPVQTQVQHLLSQMETLRETLHGDRLLLQQTVQALINSFEAKIPSAEALIQPAQIYAETAAQGFMANITTDMGELQAQVKQIIQQFDQLQTDLREDREALNTSLHQAAIALQERVDQLAHHSATINEISQLQTSLDQTLKTLKEKAVLEEVLGDLQATLQNLQPSLTQISKPRRIVLMEQEDRSDS